MRNLKELRKHARRGHDQGRCGDRTGWRRRPRRSGSTRAGRRGSASTERPVAELELGKVECDGRRYVRPAGGAGIEVVDARLLAAVDQPVAEWREPNVMAVPTSRSRR